VDIVVMVGNMVCFSKVQMDQNGIVPHWIKFRVDVDRCLKAAFAIAQTELTIAARVDIVVMVGKMVGISKVPQEATLIVLLYQMLKVVVAHISTIAPVIVPMAGFTAGS